MFGFLLIMITVHGNGFVTGVVGLLVSCLITRLWQSVENLLDGVVLCLPSDYVSVHVLHEPPGLSCFHFRDRNFIPTSVLNLEVGKEESDLELFAGEFFGRQFIVTHVESDCLLRLFTIAVFESLCQESWTATRKSVCLIHTLVSNNIKHYLFYY